MSRTRLAPALVLLALLLGIAPAATAQPIEDYPDYQPKSRCSPKAKPGTTYLGHYLVRKFGGAFGGISRPCSSGTSEHQEGRAFDWTLDATTKRGRARASAFMDWVFATDRRGNTDARARRMGVMYVIWNDHMYPAWSRYDRERYLSSGCPSRKRCSKTLRHRDHLHISLTRKGGKGRTSWYDGRLPDRG